MRNNVKSCSVRDFRINGVAIYAELGRNSYISTIYNCSVPDRREKKSRGTKVAPDYLFSLVRTVKRAG